MYLLIASTNGYTEVIEVETMNEIVEIEKELEEYNQNSLVKRWLWDQFPTYEAALAGAEEYSHEMEVA